jgi:hypothetical protein
VTALDSLHPESLLHLSLVREMLTDHRVPKRARAVDRRWTYERAIPVSVAGFNPYTNAVYYGSRSAFARWLRDPAGSARDYNEGDFLVHEVFFAVHDYLHVWTAQLLRELLPEQRLGRGPLAERDREPLAFLHLVTEAAATVGLDYWYLSTFDVNDVVPIGTTHNLLATQYCERDLAEYRRANRSFTVQTPAFFTELARFYCTGELRGFDVNDLRRSPKAFRWLRHELAYGVAQRRYIRMWLRYLATGEVARPDPRDGRAVAVSEPWQERVFAAVGEALWRKVKDGHDDLGTGATSTATVDDEPWASPCAGVPDFRFTNLNALEEVPCFDVRSGPSGEENALYLGYQLLSRYDYAAVEPELRDLLVDLVPRRGPAGVARLLRDLPRVAPVGDEPRDLMILN